MERLIFCSFNGTFRKFIIVILLCTIINVTQAQRLNTGISFDFYGIHLTKFPSDVFFSSKNYQAYYIKQIQAPSKLNFDLGLSLIVYYSRFFVNTKLNIASTASYGIIYKYSYPIAGNQYSDYYSRIEYQQAELSGSFGYFLSSRRYFRPYVEAGIGRTFPYFFSEDVSTTKSFDRLWSDRYEMRDYLELDKQYTYLMLGLGYRGDMLSVYARYNIRLGSQTVFYSNLCFGIAVYTKFSKLRKHYIYQPAN